MLVKDTQFSKADAPMETSAFLSTTFTVVVIDSVSFVTVSVFSETTTSMSNIKAVIEVHPLNA